MTDARLAEVMAYCRIETDDPMELGLIRSLACAAESYLTQAGVSLPVEGTVRRCQYDLLVNAMVLDGYDNRGSQSVGHTLSENPVFRRMLNQMKLSEPVSEVDTGTSTESIRVLLVRGE